MGQTLTLLFATLLAQYQGAYPGSVPPTPNGLPPISTHGITMPRDAMQIDIPILPTASSPNYKLQRHVELENTLLPEAVKTYDAWMLVHPKAPAGSPFFAHLNLVSVSPEDGLRGKAFRKALEKAVKALKDAGY
jgi:hypothetical protein